MVDAIELTIIHHSNILRYSIPQKCYMVNNLYVVKLSIGPIAVRGGKHRFQVLDGI